MRTIRDWRLDAQGHIVTGAKGRRVPGWRLPGAASVLVAVVVVAVAGSGAVLAAQDGGPGDEQLVEQLVTLEDTLQGIALLPDVTVFEDRTWGTLDGDFVGASIILEEADGDLEALVASASDARTPTGDAVQAVAGAYRTMAQGYAYLAAYERAGLTPAPPDTGDPLEPEERTLDEARGPAEIGLDLLLEALPAFGEGYAALRDSEAAGSAQPLFETRFVDVQQTARAEAPDARLALSYPSTHRLLAVQRFEPRFGGDEPERVTRYLCVDAEDYLDARPDDPVQDLEVPPGEVADLPFDDCPAFDNGNDVLLVEPGA